MNKVKWIITHHTGGTNSDPLADTSNQTFEDVNAWHRQSPDVWLGYYSSLGFAIGYQYFIDKNGKVTQGRLDTDIGAHTRGYNDKSLGICLAGNFDVTLPTAAQIAALSALLVRKSLQYSVPIANVIPHRHFAKKSCYGSKLSDTWARDLITNYKNNDFGHGEAI